MASKKNGITRVAKKHKPAYRRILLKLSGEAFQGPQGFGIHGETILSIARELKDVHALGVETAIMVGGGNIFRGARQKGFEIDRATGDYMGMLATAISLCMDNGMPIVVFNMNRPGNIKRVVLGERVGSKVTPA